MKFCDLIKTIWENITTEKSFFVKVITSNALICLMYLIIPASIKTFLGVVFASAGENSVGIYEFLEDNLLTIENVISAIMNYTSGLVGYGTWSNEFIKTITINITCSV